MKPRSLLAVFFLCLVLAAPTLAGGWRSENDTSEIEGVFADLEKAYETEDLELYIACHQLPFAHVEAASDGITLIDEQTMRTEMANVFAMLDGIRVDFLNLEIVVLGDVAMARTVRRGIVPGMPTVYLEMIYTLNRVNGYRGGRNWKLAGDTVLAEIKVAENNAAPGTEEDGTAGTGKWKGK